jgi:hypothetical protein
MSMGWTLSMEQSLVSFLSLLYYPISLAFHHLAHLQYLDAKELEAYLKALLESRNLLAQDGNYINVFHKQHFAAASAKYVCIVTIYSVFIYFFSTQIQAPSDLLLTVARGHSPSARGSHIHHVLCRGRIGHCKITHGDIGHGDIGQGPSSHLKIIWDQLPPVHRSRSIYIPQRPCWRFECRP